MKIDYLNMIDNPLVSIVTPSLNQGRYLNKTIESVLSQDYPEIEYWVIDGGSSDDTLDILQQHEKDLRFNWISEPDHGQADAIQKGWNKSNGEILGWLNSDDLYKSGTIQKAVTSLGNNPLAAFVYSNYETIDSDGQLLKKTKVRQSDLSDQLLLNCQIPQQTVFIRRTALENCGGLNIDLHYMLDQELWLRVLEIYLGKYNNDTWAQQRIHHFAKTQAQWSKLYEEYYLIVKQYYTHQNIPIDIRAEALRRSLINMFIVESYQDNMEKAIAHLKLAIKNGLYPFGSASHSIKHIVYILNHWLDPQKTAEIFQQLVEFSHIQEDHRILGFLWSLKSYNAYQNENFQEARIWIAEAFKIQPELKEDLYLKTISLRCIFSGYPVKIYRYIRKI